MNIDLKEATAGQEVALGYFLDSTDGDTEETGLTIANTDIKLHKTGATTLANKNSGGATHISDGIYYTTLDATDTDTVGPMVIFIHVAGALTVKVGCNVLPANIFDSKYSTDKLQVDVTQLGGVTQSATDLKDFVDAGYDPSAHKVQGVVLVDTTTTNTDVRGTDGANTVVPDAAGVAPTAIEIRAEMDSNSTQLSAIVADTNELQADWTNGGRLDLILDIIAADTTTDIPALIAALQTDLDTLTDAAGEPGDIAPPVSVSLVDKVAYLYKFARNKIETTATRIHVYDDAGTNKDHSSVISDDGTTFTRGEFEGGD